MDGWAVTPGAARVNNTRTKIVTQEDIDKLSEQTRQNIEAGVSKIVPVGTGNTGHKVRQYCGEEIYPNELMYIDLFDELAAAVQAVAALNCENVTTSPGPNRRPDLNKRRIAKGKAPFFSYHILECTDDGSAARGPHQGGTHASPRSHLRRGHIRRLSDTRSTWVRASMVGSKSSGIVKKITHLRGDQHERRTTVLRCIGRSVRHHRSA